MYATTRMNDATSDTGQATRTDVVAGDAGFFDVFHMRVERGRAFTEEESRHHARVCVVGHVVAAKLWTTDPIGRVVGIGGLRCRVIGVLADNRRWGTSFGFDWVDLIVVPHETAADEDPAVRDGALFVAKTDDRRANDVVKRITNALLVERHHNVDDFTLYDFSNILERFDEVFAVMEIIVGAIAGVALVIGGIGVMNMMLVAVTERVREIGIRKALGARSNDIAAQFLLEAMLLTAAGGVIGAAAGAGAALLASFGISRAVPRWLGGVSMPAVVVALVVCFGIGLLFGWAPARRAAGLSPIEAMRR
jgi:putative ABC transport system permease protein